VNKKLFVIDLMPFLYKGHFAFLKNPRITSTGMNTSALIGFANGVSAILKDHAPTHAVLAMDPGGPTFRHERYPAYKAQRDKMPEDLAACIPRAFELADALNIPVVKCDGFEADDVIGTIAVKGALAGFDVYVATPDKDAAQLVGPNVKLFRPGYGNAPAEIYDEEKVKSHWDLASARQMIDYLALAGDTADNIPGIRGVGEKTAVQLLKDWGTVENLVDHASALKGKLAEKVANGREDAILSKFLTTIRTDVPLEIDWTSFERREPDREKLAAVCARYELTQFAKRHLGEAAVEAAPKRCKTIVDTPHDYRLVTTEEEARALASVLESAPKFAFDTETAPADAEHDARDARTARLVGMSFATEPGKAWYVAVPEHGAEKRVTDPSDLFAAAEASSWDADAARDKARAFVGIFAQAFADPAKLLIAQNAKYDYTVLSRYGIRFGSTVRDTMLEHYVTDAAARHGMDALAREFLDYDPIPIEKIIGEAARGKRQKTMDELAPAEILDYAAEDADVTLRLDAVLRRRADEAGASRALVESEEPLVPVLSAMEREGVRIDTAALSACGEALGEEIAQYEARIREAAADPEMNIDSPRQLGAFIFEKLLPGHPAGKKTSTGQWATDEKTLLKLEDAHPVIRDILEYRACTKLKSTYVDKLPTCIDPEDGRVHTTFAQAFTETGRLSSSDPNLQNIPVRSARGKLIRAAIVARDGNHRLVSADYSQIELRLMAAMSGDEAMLGAFARGEDIHRDTASRVYDCMPALVTDEMRSRCKMVNFGIIYGISAFGLSQRLRIPRKEAAELIETYFKLYPKVRAFMDKAVADARAKGYAETALGRRRTLRDIDSRNATARQAAERDAINTPIQGTAADLIKLAMVKTERALRQARLKTKMILQIHDELLFDAPLDEVEKVKAIAAYEMKHAMDLGVPLDVSVGVGENWLEAH